MGRVVLQLVDHVVQVHEGVVDVGHGHGLVVLEGGAQHQTADAAEAVDTYSDGHLDVWILGLL